VASSHQLAPGQVLSPISSSPPKVVPVHRSKNFIVQ
jgi:hypothetical protein